MDNANVDDLLQVIAGMYEPPLARWDGRFAIRQPYRASWEVILTQHGTAFHLAVPSLWQAVVTKQLNVVWPRATVQVVDDPLAGQPTAVAKMELREHYMFSLRADKRSGGVLPSLLECIRMLGPDERISVQVLMEPAPHDWYLNAASAYEGLRHGKMPQRLRLDAKEVAKKALQGATLVVMEACSLVSELASGKPLPPVDFQGVRKGLLGRDSPHGSGAADKLRGEALDVTVRVAVQASSPTSGTALMRAVGYAFRTIDGENALVMSPEKGAWEKMCERQPGLKLNNDYLCFREVAGLLQLPTGPLQDEFRLRAINHRETDLPKAIVSGGLRIGTHTYKGVEVPVYLPTDNHDELCLPHVVIGGMGCGKTRGFGSNLVVEAVRNGFGAVVIDPAKGEIGDEVASALPADKVIRIRFGSKPVALDWREAQHSQHSRNRLANELIAFVDAATDEAGAQTVRYLRAAAKAVPTGRLSEVVSLLTEPDYRANLIPAMRPQEAMVWEAFGKLTDARQAQIALPVLNRLDVILGDDYLASCMDASEGIDFVTLLEKPCAIIIDIPKAELGHEAVDVLASLMATKLDLAMVLRTSKHPVFIVQDEPHQYMRSSRTWKAAAVESRKWRFAYTWLFHSWEQIDRDVAAIIQAAGSHYHLYSSSKATFRALAEEISPFELEEALKIPRHWALHVLRAGGEVVTPFLAKMDVPPSKRRSAR